MQLTDPAKKTKRDLLLILALAVVIGGGFLVKSIFFGKPGVQATIRQAGGKVTTVSLDKDQTFVVDDSFGGTNTITIKDGTIAVTESNCPDHLCEWFGAISETGQAIACLPHGLVISIGEPEDEIFAVNEQ